MGYAQATDMVTRFGQEELEQLAPSDTAEEFDQEKVDSALSDASAEMNTYLGSVYALPLTDPNPYLKTICCDITRFRLWDDAVSEEVRKRYEDAVAWLKKVVKGDVSLGIDNQEEVFYATTSSNAGNRTFTRSSLDDF
ncbi:gp436 family protein [Idiomarina aminovorans]|uniref:gp436 family protein n=1 Tax=Idiomarina aminovorans TaxID=2914829 RepID=UPI002003B272|nr:phage protein Gp36 family protein [Idiomarina sp. ATCH4]MCK7458496.1 DUF1320 family protein [Idiomarina sp. ATCH4]